MVIETREAVRFASGNDECAAFHYRGSNGACVVMGSGVGVTKEPGTDRFAARFHDAGFSVLAFDHRHFGESGGRPRQVVKINRQLQDWCAAVTYAATLPGVDPARIAVWGFSTAGGHVLRIAARTHLPIAAAIAQTPYVDGLASSPSALRYETPSVIARMPFIAAADVVRGWLGRDPLLVPLSGPRGTVALLTTPDSADGDRALNPDGAYPNWVQAVAARSVLPLGSYRPGRRAAQIRCPVLVVVARADTCVFPERAVGAARSAPQGELVEVAGGHYAPFLDAHETVVTAELDFLGRHLLDPTTT
jgi:pimeloyl-ACP methyl ester carboxylesterase